MKIRFHPAVNNAFRISVLALGLILTGAAALGLWLKREHRLQPEQRMRQQFESHRSDYIQFVTLLRKDPFVKYVGSDGIHGRVVPEYQDLMRKIGAKFVIIREDGSMEFALLGHGGAIMSDSYSGVRYFPKDHKVGSRPGWTQTVVASLASEKLPKEQGSVATGLYVVPIEPEWFTYRFEYQE